MSWLQCTPHCGSTDHTMSAGRSPEYLMVCCSVPAHQLENTGRPDSALLSVYLIISTTIRVVSHSCIYILAAQLGKLSP